MAYGRKIIRFNLQCYLQCLKSLEHKVNEEQNVTKTDFVLMKVVRTEESHVVYKLYDFHFRFLSKRAYFIYFFLKCVAVKLGRPNRWQGGSVNEFLVFWFFYIEASWRSWPSLIWPIKQDYKEEARVRVFQNIYMYISFIHYLYKSFYTHSRATKIFFYIQTFVNVWH